MPGYARDPSNIASAVSVNPSGNISATNVESALYELDLEKAFKTFYQSASATPLGIGQIWVDSDNNNLYVYNGSSYVTAGGAGATGGGSDKVFYENDITVTTSYTITAGKNAITAGPITVNNGVTITVPNNSTWTVI